MKKFTKALVLLLTLALVCTGLILAVSADDAQSETVSYVANGETANGTLADAVAAADEGTTVKLLGNCTVSAEIAVTKSVTVDLNGYTLTTSTANAFSVSGATTVFKVTGTGNITAAGTLVTAKDDGATINLVGAGVDGIAVTHTGESDVNFVVLKTNTFELNNFEIVSKKGAQSNAFIENSGNSTMTIKKTSVNLDYNNLNGWNSTLSYFTRVGGTSHLTIEDSAFYTRNVFIEATNMANSTNESISIKDSVIRVNDTDKSSGGARLALIFAGNSNTAKGVVNVYDSVLECAGRMFASEVNNTAITVNAYGVTMKASWSECDQLSNSSGGNINRRFKALNLYNSESGRSCKIISVDGWMSYDTNCGGLLAYTPGLRVNLAAITTATTVKYGIQIPSGIDENGNVTGWTYAASSTDGDFAWVYDPVGDPDAPYVLIDKTKTTVVVPNYYNNIGFDGIRFDHKNGRKDTVLRTENVTNGNIVDAEAYGTYMQVSVGRGTLSSIHETGNAYIRYAVTPYEEKYTTTNSAGETVTITAKDIYGSSYNGSTRNFDTEKTKDNGGAADPFFILGKNLSDAALIENTSYNTKKVIVQEMDFGTDSDIGFPSIGICIQVRQAGTSVSNSSQKIDISNAGVIGNKLYDAENPITSLNKHEWYRISVVCYTETNEIHFFINGAYMGKAPGYKDGTNLDANVYFQGIRVNVYKSSTHKVNSSFAIDNVSTRSYAGYQYGETTPDATTAANYITTASPRQYMGKTLTVNGIPMADMEEAVDVATRLNDKIDINKIFNLGDFTENATVDFNGNNVTYGNGSYGFVKNGTNYTFNENYYYNAYYYTGDVGNISAGTYDESDFTLFGEAKLGFTLDIPNYYTDRVVNYVNYTVDTQNGWIYDTGATDPVLPKVPDLSDLENCDENKNVYYLPFLDSVPMTHLLKNASGDIVSYGISNDDTNDAFRNPVSGTTLVLLQDYSVVGGTDSYIRIKNDDPIVTTDGVTTVNGVVIDNDYTDEEIATMREVASDFRIDLNGKTLDMNKYRLVIGQNIEYSIYSSVPGAKVNMVYKNGTAIAGARTFNMLYLDGTTKWDESKAAMLKNMNSRYNFGTYTDRNGNVVESEMLTMTGAVIFEAAAADSSCSYNINNVMASRVTSDSNGLVVSRAFDGKITIENSILSTFGKGDKPWLVDVRAGDGTFHPDIVFEDCLFLYDGQGSKNAAVSNGGPSNDSSVNVVFNNCVSNLRINSAERNHVYFGEGTTADFMFVSNHYITDDLVEAYSWEPMTLGGFAEDGVQFIKINKPVYDSATGGINYDNYYYFVNNGYGEEFAAQYSDVQYKELPILTTKIVKKTDAVKVTFNNLDGSAAREIYYVKGVDVQAKISNNDSLINNIALTGDAATYGANAVTLTYTGWEALPTNVQEDVVINPTYTVSANVNGLKANLSLYSDFDVNLYIPAKYAEYIDLFVGEDGKNLTAVKVGDVDYLMATVSQKCNMAGENIVFDINIAETVNGKVCNATAKATISIATYASAVLAGENFTDSDKVLMYYMLNYANEAEKYIDGAADETIVNVMNTAAAYAEKYVVDYNYDKLFSTDSISAVFTDATLDIESSPAFVFTLKDGFEGTVTVTYGGGLNERVYNVTADNSRKIVIEGMKVYNFGTVLNITANGTVNGEAVSVEGNYTLDNFAKYHTDNAADETSETMESSAACLPLVKALFAYAEVAELYKTNSLADALVGAAE